MVVKANKIHDDDGLTIEGEVVHLNADDELGKTAPKENDDEPKLEDDDEVVLTLGDEEPPKDDEDEEHASAPEWVKELRKSHREIQRENRELKKQIKTINTPETKPEVKISPKPKLDEFDYDTDEYDAALEKWYDDKAKVAAANKAAQDAQKAASQAWQARLDGYSKAKSELKIKDFDDLENIVSDALDKTQLGIIVQGADNSAQVVAVLGKNEARLKELVTIKDPVKFAFAVAKLEKDIKVTNRKKVPPTPERVISGAGPTSGAVDSTLAKLREDAARTGDYTKVTAYKRKLRDLKQ